MVLDFHKEAPKDRDGDGIDDLRDLCGDIPEDKDGYRDRDGCPELDNDLDGFVDNDDDCPMEAETVNGVDDHDGCPDRNLRLVISAEANAERIQWQVGDRSLQSFPGESVTVDGIGEAPC